MPAPETPRLHESRPILGHVNLMVDTFIANAHVEDLRHIIRVLLATTPDFAAEFTTAARARLRQTNASALPNSNLLFARQPGEEEFMPTEDLKDALSRARSLYGAGMGIASLGLLTSIVRATVGIRWDEEGDMAEVLAEIDADIAQASQSCKEETESGRVSDVTSVVDALKDLQTAVDDSFQDVQSWGGIFPFDKAASSIRNWKS